MKMEELMIGERLVLSMSKILLILAFVIIAPVGVTAQVWTVLAVDPKGDGRDPALPDAAQLSYRYDKPQDLLWFRVSLYGKPIEESFGVNIVVDTGADDAAKMNWWGANQEFKFDKLVTAWVTRGDGGYQGTIGAGDVTAAQPQDPAHMLQH